MSEIPIGSMIGEVRILPKNEAIDVINNRSFFAPELENFPEEIINYLEICLPLL